MPIHLIKICFLLLICLSPVPNAFAQQSAAPNKESAEEKSYFDFLLGNWKVEKKETPAATTTGGSDTYQFRRALEGNGIISDWNFDRGTREKPDYTKGIYVSAFDPSAKSWSFYYISDRSSQYWEGKKENGNWVFYKKFNINGTEIIQRQQWELTNDSKLVRRIESSNDDGKSWKIVVVITMSKEMS